MSKQLKIFQEFEGQFNESTIHIKVLALFALIAMMLVLYICSPNENKLTQEDFSKDAVEFIEKK